MMRLQHTLVSLSLVVAISLGTLLLFAVPVAASGGVFTVNTPNDSNTLGDAELSLREAVRIANAELLGPFSAAERAQMAGCTFTAGGSIGNNCGGGQNTIRFAPALTQVNVNGRLPLLTSAGVTFDGQVNAGPIIVNSTADDLGIFIGADDATIKNIAAINFSQPFAVASNIPIKHLRIFNSYLGVAADTTSCSDPRLVRLPLHSFILFKGYGTGAPGDGTAYLYGNTMGCAHVAGVELPYVSYVYVGEDPNGTRIPNYIGVKADGHPLPFTGSSGYGAGIQMYSSGPQHNVVVSNTIAYGVREGIYVGGVSDSASSENLISGNDIHHNGTAGILLSNAHHNILSDNLVHDNGSSGIWITGATASQNSISGDAYYHNGAAGITEGDGASNNIWRSISTYQNVGLGIDKGDNGAPNPPALVIDGLIRASRGITVTGRYTGLMLRDTLYTVDVYRLEPDRSGYGEGRTYIGSSDVVTLVGKGYAWSVLDRTSTARCYTAVLTVTDPHGASTPHTSSEFSRNYAVGCVDYLPLVLKHQAH